MSTHPEVTELTIESFHEQLAAYLKQHPTSSEGLLFEQFIEKEAHDRLAITDRSGWDFETALLFFDDRGTSILIQNAGLDWQSMLKWLYDFRKTMPSGCIVNFEVYDSIQGSQMTGGQRIGRWVFTPAHAFMHR